jgi:hypothetical protein
MVLITIVNGVYKPTYNWGAPHCTLYVYIYITAVSHFIGPWVEFIISKFQQGRRRKTSQTGFLGDVRSRRMTAL